MKFFASLAATAIYIMLLLLVYYLHVNYFTVNVVFYAAIFDAFVALVLTVALVITLRYFRILSGFEKFLLIVIWLLGGYGYAISGPTVLDRSLSFYILEKLQQRGGGIREDAFTRLFTEEYVREHRLVDVRLTEQEQSGTIIIADGCVRLTATGNLIATISRYLRQHFLPKKRLLMGEYTDDLRDPFRQSEDIKDYNC